MNAKRKRIPLTDGAAKVCDLCKRPSETAVPIQFRIGFCGGFNGWEPLQLACLDCRRRNRGAYRMA